ncbi:hypothetical protein BC830DRAFT_1135616 [Chytriomyces sp. MP71]|nr:hypothetical protein BC830DRAFT_1135616 [Chytriomyces sp. MP71]
MRSILPRSTLVSPSPTAIPLLLDAKLRNKCHSNILQRFFNPMTEEGMNLVNEFHPDCRRQKAAVQGRFRPSDRELTLLNAIFEVNYFPSLSIRRKLAAKFCVDPRQVQFWYQNKRAHVRAAGTILRRANDL